MNNRPKFEDLQEASHQMLGISWLFNALVFVFCAILLIAYTCDFYEHLYKNKKPGDFKSGFKSFLKKFFIVIIVMISFFAINKYLISGHIDKSFSTTVKADFFDSSLNTNWYDTNFKKIYKDVKIKEYTIEKLMLIQTIDVKEDFVDISVGGEILFKDKDAQDFSNRLNSKEEIIFKHIKDKENNVYWIDFITVNKNNELQHINALTTIRIDPSITKNKALLYKTNEIKGDILGNNYYGELVLSELPK